MTEPTDDPEINAMIRAWDSAIKTESLADTMRAVRSALLARRAQAKALAHYGKVNAELQEAIAEDPEFLTKQRGR